MTKITTMINQTWTAMLSVSGEDIAKLSQRDGKECTIKAKVVAVFF